MISYFYFTSVNFSKIVCNLELCLSKFLVSLELKKVNLHHFPAGVIKSSDETYFKNLPYLTVQGRVHNYGDVKAAGS